jgi:hypothetical protein
MGNDPANLTDPSGGCTVCWEWVQKAVESMGTLQPVTVIGQVKTVTTATKVSLSFVEASAKLLSYASNLAWNRAGFSAALSDNAFGTNLLTNNAPGSLDGSAAWDNWNAGVTAGNAASLAIAAMEGGVGESLITGGSIATATVVGAEVGVPAAAVGRVLTLHSIYFFHNALNNTVKGAGQVKFESEVQPSETGGANTSEGTNAGTQVNSKTLWKGDGKERIDVENPNPTQRPGQIHYQDNNGNKYIYDSPSNTFRDAPKKVNKLLDKPEVKKAIEKGLKYLNG